MHIPLVIAILAVLALALLSLLDHFNTAEINAKAPHSYFIRIAHWAKE